METQSELSQYELERGKPMPSKNHSRLQLRMGKLLIDKYDERYDFHSELSLQLSTGKATPDICIYPKEVIDWFNDEVRVTEPPLTAIEILSPTQGLQDVTEKLTLYFGAGVKSVWVVIPTFKTIYVITPERDVKTFTTGTLTDAALDIRLDMDALFR